MKKLLKALKSIIASLEHCKSIFEKNESIGMLTYMYKHTKVLAPVITHIFHNSDFDARLQSYLVTTFKTSFKFLASRFAVLSQFEVDNQRKLIFRKIFVLKFS